MMVNELILKELILEEKEQGKNIVIKSDGTSVMDDVEVFFIRIEVDGEKYCSLTLRATSSESDCAVGDNVAVYTCEDILELLEKFGDISTNIMYAETKEAYKGEGGGK
jgi:hypothetical protein